MSNKTPKVEIDTGIHRSLRDPSEKSWSHSKQVERRANIKRKAAGVVVGSLAVLGIGWVGGEDMKAEMRAANKTNTETSVDEPSYTRAPSPRELQNKAAEAEMIKSLESGNVLPEPGALIIDRGVRVRKTPIIKGYSEGSDVDYVTDKVMVISNPIILDGNIIVPSSGELSYISTAIMDQMDEDTGNRYAKFVDTKSGFEPQEGDILHVDIGSVFSVERPSTSENFAVSLVNEFDSMEKAKAAIGD